MRGVPVGENLGTRGLELVAKSYRPVPGCQRPLGGLKKRLQSVRRQHPRILGRRRPWPQQRREELASAGVDASKAQPAIALRAGVR